ncbi:MAG TPA: DUF2231 domain-containing protein [Candidatus Baltobacteraceae bacterium]|jgi:uncharacterized membrane protein|nr:DUF2231 domain-containing protein [Candidatus Baltobacteraceae bacterium]
MHTIFLLEVAMQGKAVIAGHPIHPALVAIPIGLFVGTLICDVVSIWGDPQFWPRAATWLIAFGVIGALVAAIFGFVDYFTAPMSEEAKRTATTHMVLNLIAVVVFAIAFFIRLHSMTSVLGYVLTYVALAILSCSGWLGGKLAYHFGVGVEDRAPR